MHATVHCKPTHRRKPPVLAGCRRSRWEYCVCSLINTNLQSWDKNLKKKRFNEMSVGQVGRVMDGGEIPSAVLEVNTNAVWPDQKAGLLLSLCSSLLPCSSSFRPSPAPHSPPQSFLSYPALCFICFCCPVLFSLPHTRYSSPSSILVLVTSLVPPALFSSLWILLFCLLISWVRNDPRLYNEPFSLHVRNVHSAAQLSPNSQ